MTDQPSITFGDDRLSAELVANDTAVHLTLRDADTGKTHGPAPLLALEIHDKTVRREERLEQYQVERCQPTANGAHVAVGVARCGVVVELLLSIETGELVVRSAAPQIYEHRPAHFRLFAIDILPTLMATRDDGMLLLPTGRGGICYPGDKPAIEDRFLLYAEQPRWELLPLLPFCAAWDPNGGLMALAARGDCDTQCRVATDGRGAGRTGFAMSLRRHWPDPVDHGPRELRYAPIPARHDPSQFIADRLRRHMTDDLGKPTITERAAESPEVAYALDGMTLKMAFAQENEGMEMAGKDKSDPVTYQLGLTFAEGEQALSQLHQAGIDKAQFFCVGWNPRGHDGLYPTRFPIDERLGGEAGFRRLIDHGHALGYRMSVHDNFMMNLPHSPDWDPECVTHDMYGEPLLHGWWSGGLEYQSWPPALGHNRLGGHLERMKELGLGGIYYCDYMMQPLEVNYHPRHRGSRADHARGQMRILDQAKHTFGAVAMECGMFPALMASDYTCATGGKRGDPSWPITTLVDRETPIWELVTHGLLIRENTGIRWPQLMNCVLWGAHLRMQFTGRPFRGNLLPIGPETAGQIKSAYDLCVKRFGYLKPLRIVGYENPEPQVHRTTFEDGTTITADFSNHTLFANDAPIERPDAVPAAT